MRCRFDKLRCLSDIVRLVVTLGSYAESNNIDSTSEDEYTAETG